MGQKIHPTGFRLGVTKTYQSQWFTDSAHYPNLIIEDYFIRNKLFQQFPNATISKIEIQRKFNDQIQISIYSPKPSIILTFYKNDLKILSVSLTKQIQKHRRKKFYNLFQKETNLITLHSLNPKITVQIFELFKPDKNADFIADFLVEQLQKRAAFRKVMKKALRRAQRSKIHGIKIQISGRLNGAEIARSEWMREGKIPLQTLRAKIDYCYRTAKTIYGILGVKVWMFND